MGELGMHTLSVCRTCPRHLSEKGGLPEQVREAVQAGQGLDGFQILTVECLGGCRQPSAAVFDAPEKWRIRMTCLVANDANDLLTAARIYVASPDGDLQDDALPENLRGKISARSPKYPTRAAALGVAPNEQPDEHEIKTLPRFKRN
jgi:predicted metal-binding protein